jgi:hypothetical protein
LFKFRDNDGNWREQRLEEDILKVAVGYIITEDETGRVNLRVEGEQEWVEWTVA